MKQRAGAYYNEHDAKAAAWIRELITQKHIADGEVDERSIVNVAAEDGTVPFRLLQKETSSIAGEFDPAMTSRLDKQAVELREDLVPDEVRDLAQRLRHRLPTDRGDKIIEDYCGGRMWLHLHIGFGNRVSEVQGRDWCITFRRGCQELGELSSVQDGAAKAVEADSRDANGRDGDEQLMVFVFVGEFVQSEERVVFRKVASQVRLYRVDFESGGFFHKRHSSVPLAQTPFAAPILRMSRADGELDLAQFLSPLNGQVPPGELPNNVVESTSHVVKDVADQQGPVERLLVSQCAVDGDPLPIWVYLDARGNGFCAKKGVDLPLERAQVVFRP